MHARAKLNYSDLECLNDEGKRFELYEGELFVTAAPSGPHQKVSARLVRTLEDKLEARGLATVYQAVDVYFGPHSVYCPDVVVVPFGAFVEKYFQGAPLIAIEVLSPSTERFDRTVKFQQYARFGIHEYWIVDPDAHVAEVHSLKGDRYELFGRFEENDTLHSAQFADLTILLTDIWPKT
jgi:Uma2 family endonuclease